MRRLSFVSLLMLFSVSGWAQSAATGVYIDSQVNAALIDVCKAHFPQQKMLFSQHLQSWRVKNQAAIGRGKEDVKNLATLLGQPEAALTRQKVEGALTLFQKNSPEQRQQLCQTVAMD